MNIQDHIHNFIINNRSSNFTLEDFKNSLDSATESPTRILEDHLEESPLLFTSSDKTALEKSYTSRKNFFYKAEFIVTPTALEIQKGILFSGHRFIPFYSHEIYPTESFKIKTGSGAIIETKKLKFKLEDLYYYYSLLGAEGIIDELSADHIENVDLVGNPSQKINVTVFDFSEFYKKTSFIHGMSLKFSVNDWNEGKFSVSIHKETVTDDKKHKWFETLEEGLIKVFEKIGPYLEIPEQLAIGYYYSGSSILKSPPCSINDFIKRSQKIQIKFHEKNTILWYSADDSISQEPVDEMVSISQGTIESLDAILDELGLLITSVEIEAFSRDSLFSGNNSFASTLHKLFPKSGLTFKDKAQETAFFNHLEELWEDITTDYNADVDSIIASPRKDILDNLEILYNWFNDTQSLIIEKGETIESEITELHKNIKTTRKILDTLNRNQPDLDLEDTEQLNEIIFNQLQKNNDLIDIVNSLID